MDGADDIASVQLSGCGKLELKVVVVANNKRTSAVPHLADIPRKTLLWHPGIVRVRSARPPACDPARPGVPQTPARREDGRSYFRNRAREPDRPAARSLRLQSTPGLEGCW